MQPRATTFFLAMALIATALLTPSAADPGPAVFRAGAAKAEITPPVGTPMWGYTARHALLAMGDDLSGGAYPRFLDQRDDNVDTELYGKTFMKSEGVHTRLYANAFVLDDGTRVVAIVLADLGGVPGELHQAVVSRLADFGVPIGRENLLLGSTHTHGGPGGFFQYQGYALLGGDEFDPRVLGLIADQIARAVKDAYDAREPASIAIGSATIEDASRNRSTGAHVTDHAHDTAHVKQLARVMRIDAVGPPAKPLGAIVNFAAHGTIVGDKDLLFTGDNQGVAARLIARGIADASGEDEHDVVVTYLNGAQGDVSPIGAGSDFFARVEDAGARQAGPIVAAWSALAGAGTTSVTLDTRFKFLCFCGQEVEDGGRISVVPILGTGDKFPEPFGIPGHGSKVPLLIGTPGMVPHVVRLQAMRINDYVMVTMPGEASVALGGAIEADIAALSPGVTVDIVGLANDYISYMSTLGEYDYQDYEGTFNLYGRMTGPLFRNELAGLAGALLSGTPVAPGHEGVVEHPDTTTPTVGPLTLVPGSPPAIVTQPAATVASGASAVFAWRGGSPAVDHPVDAVMVQIRDATTGAVVTDDRGFEVRLRYAKMGADEHRWTAEFPVTAALPTGTYEFRVMGRYVTTPGTVADYAWTSTAFVV